MKFLPWTEGKTLIRTYTPVEKFFLKWRWNCGIIRGYEFGDELFRYFYDCDQTTPRQRIIDELYNFYNF